MICYNKYDVKNILRSAAQSSFTMSHRQIRAPISRVVAFMVLSTRFHMPDLSTKAPKTADFFAELYVAGRFAELGWNIYFPRRDRGFDFIVSKSTSSGEQLLRPVQVKGKYPTPDKGDRDVYGYIGELSEVHREMVLAIPYFAPGSYEVPISIAYLPFGIIRGHSRGSKCEPAYLRGGIAHPRRDYQKFFGDEGLKLVERDDWSSLGIGATASA